MKFKVLMYGLNMFVDHKMLNSGVYMTDMPVLYKSDATIDAKIDQMRQLNEEAGGEIFSDEYIKNFNKCYLRDVTLNIDEGFPIKTIHEIRG